MSDYTIQEIEGELVQLIESGLPDHPAADVNAALQVANLLEDKGYAFAMKDLCPKSMYDSMWRAVFSKDGDDFSSENSESAVAVCAAAIAALKGV